jgi:hypothetical protein
MGDSQGSIADKPLHPQAAELIKQYASDFAESLIFQSKILAHQRKDDVVLRSHVEEALTILSTRQQKWRDQIAIILGSALFGAFVQGFTDQWFAEMPNMPLIAVYVVLGFVGVFGIFYGLRRL